jgi:hypothetical protein
MEWDDTGWDRDEIMGIGMLMRGGSCSLRMQFFCRDSVAGAVSEPRVPPLHHLSLALLELLTPT